MPQTTGKHFAFRDIIQLDRDDIYKLMRDLGLIELGQAFAAVGRMALAELCRRLPRAKAEELILAVRSASKVDIPDLKTAQRFLSRVVVNFDDTEEFFQKAGLWRIAKGALLEDEVFRAAFRQRLPRSAGELFDTFFDKAGEMEDLTPDMLQRAQDATLRRVQKLAKDGAISPQWRHVELNLHDPNPQTDAEPDLEDPDA